MPSYVVELSIDIEADAPVEAARQALAIMQRPDTTANVFTVLEEGAEPRRVDLQEVDEDQACRRCGAVEGSEEYGTVGDGFDGLCPSCADAAEGWFVNHYRCDDCGESWTDEWSCMCNDECPSCGKEIEPYESEDAEKEGESHG